MKTQDIIIIGGGMVGAAAALGLAKQGLNIALIEKIRFPHLMRMLLMICVFPLLVLPRSNCLKS
ncbi:2-octaprenyl-3-methyl-6-methoxy-1,4-benzoquinol hydroxylase [Actinobacillus equuli]|nr:2-octaprenyl-3-methyl-6-methoxy-1,4-benzoquinol hydroxylase [Actinobacillus equuli]